MWFWEAIERRVRPAMDLDKARQVLASAGLIENGSNPAWLLFTRPGSSWTPDTAKARMKVGVALGESELYLLLKYQSIWPSLNARDLETFADELCRLLGCADNRLSN
jgi:hypothetical protein